MKAYVRRIPVDPNNLVHQYPEVTIALVPEEMAEVACIRWIQELGIIKVEFSEGFCSDDLQYSVRLIGKNARINP